MARVDTQGAHVAAFVVGSGSGVDVISLSTWKEAEAFARKLSEVPGGLAGPLTLRSVGRNLPAGRWVLDVALKRWVVLDE